MSQRSKVRFSVFGILLLSAIPLWAQDYQVKNDRILSPEVSHFTRPNEPGVDAHGDLNLSLPIMTAPGRDGLNFDVVAQYRSGIPATQSASWIGLGWSLDLGSITRHPLGGIQSHLRADFTHALPDAYGPINSQPDACAVNMNGNSALLLYLASTVIGQILSKKCNWRRVQRSNAENP